MHVGVDVLVGLVQLRDEQVHQDDGHDENEGGDDYEQIGLPLKVLIVDLTPHRSAT